MFRYKYMLCSIYDLRLTVLVFRYKKKNYKVFVQMTFFKNKFINIFQES